MCVRECVYVYKCAFVSSSISAHIFVWGRISPWTRAQIFLAMLEVSKSQPSPFPISPWKLGFQVFAICPPVTWVMGSALWSFSLRCKHWRPLSCLSAPDTLCAKLSRVLVTSMILDSLFCFPCHLQFKLSHGVSSHFTFIFPRQTVSFIYSFKNYLLISWSCSSLYGILGIYKWVRQPHTLPFMEPGVSVAKTNIIKGAP